MKGNDFVSFALRTPLHVLMGNTILLTITGRKTGRKISLPVNYYQDGNNLWVVSRRDRSWWRNLLKGGDVDVRLHGRDLHGFGEAILKEEDVAGQLAEYVRHLPISASSLGVRVEGGTPNSEDIARAAKERLFVRICLA